LMSCSVRGALFLFRIYEVVKMERYFITYHFSPACD